MSLRCSKCGPAWVLVTEWEGGRGTSILLLVTLDIADSCHDSHVILPVIIHCGEGCCVHGCSVRLSSRFLSGLYWGMTSGQAQADGKFWMHFQW